MRLKLQVLVSFIFAMSLVVFATLYDVKPGEIHTPVPFLQSQHRWADSLIRKLDRSEKISQLFVVIADADSADSDTTLSRYIQKYRPGGVLFRGYGANQQWKRTRIYQASSQVPLLIGMQPDHLPQDLIQIPGNLSIAAINHDSLFEQVGTAMALQGMEMGVNAYFLPTLYKNQTPENRNQISEKILKVGNILQSQRILAIPTDIHPYFPYERDSSRLDSLLRNYKMFSRAGISGFDLDPAIIQRIKLNSGKEAIVRNYLDANINYKGLVIGELVENDEPVEEQVKKMMKAGVDLIILKKEDMGQASSAIHNLMNRTILSGPELNEKVKRVLLAKSWSRVRTTYAEVLSKDTFDIDFGKNDLLRRKLIREAITIVKDNHDQIPFKRLKDRRFHVVTVGEKAPDLINQMRFYSEISESHQDRSQGKSLKPLNVRFLSGYNPVIIAFNEESPDPNRDEEFIQSLSELSASTEVVIIHLGEVTDLQAFTPENTLVQVYGNSELHQKLVAQAVFGGFSVNGMLPLTLGEGFVYGQGDFSPKTRLSYTIPEEVGLDSRYLSYIDSVVYEGIGSFAMPGCQILVAKSGQIIYHKAFGYHTYARKKAVKLTDLYDLASVTKVVGTTSAMMKMYDQGRIDPDDMLGKFFKNQMVTLDSVLRRDTVYFLADSILTNIEEEDTTTTDDSPIILVSQRENKGLRVDSFFLGDTVMVVTTHTRGRTTIRSPIFKLRLSELMTHHSGLPAGLPVRRYINYRNKRTGRYSLYYKPRKDSLHTIQVADGFYLRRDYLDSLWDDTKRIVPDRRKGYEYSDANMILVQMAIDSVNKEPIDHYLKRELFAPLGIQNARYNPRETLDEERLIPTEYDSRWRGQLLRGYVHDPTAAIMGGVAGNAGLFSNANDLAILFQLFLNGGTYGGEQYLRETTIQKFTQAQTGHRGFGFDKPPQSGGYIIGDAASLSSYGHTGFSGTCVWVDPEKELVFIFLSNRIHPRSQNWMLNTLRIRQRVHNVIYEAIANPLP
ncbi:MAG: serine hydrolase [Bacteroidetes bacterium]|nr:serine hydrolase [Bacteroidota bacterium]